ncbi:MAG: hypothetical protein LBR89_01250 [Holosporales bacterium]|jgi:xanthine/uracil permease|nr:hypothetical protein [Holosporales bacterium]
MHPIKKCFITSSPQLAVIIAFPIAIGVLVGKDLKFCQCILCIISAILMSGVGTVIFTRRAMRNARQDEKS